jgi:hypothetical protein
VREVARARLARDLLDGRRSLCEAAALCGELNRLSPATAQTHKARYPLVGFQPRTDEEYLCAQVMNGAYTQVFLTHRDHDRAMAAVARLEAEFRDELRRAGAIRLPDPSTLTPVEQLLDEARVAWQNWPRPATPNREAEGEAGK